ncbi:hypothetical protein [Bdellovibrio sp. HCB337]|uniref:hypothetical protein n=1 Tax=Bdellovibrio sp. HCB337 TaxID=3394358 RepID=UPI0039A77A3D
MNTKLLTLTFLVSAYCLPTLASEAPWIFTSSMASKNEMISIQKKEFCRPISTTLMSNKCVQYKQGYVCPQEDEGQFVISTYNSKKDCDKALKRAKKLLARK